jgi:uncharacterized membrane protein YtjA (UPF0391 family)
VRPTVESLPARPAPADTHRDIDQPITEADEVTAMLYWALIFLVVAIIAGILGFGGVASTATGIAKILFIIFLVVFLVTAVANFV